ncbi:hypothetical protein BDN70DRAFT_874139 [Pholiota conissans]|uniref:Uncharacterized protein n=1 Tax=Pholiota conissans TaxID=109636 RepID=A0A9P5Z8W6_9AGAR|nr:hypothetical protein BDN70DRAFT_874139 [Pholiota conissans]
MDRSSSSHQLQPPHPPPQASSRRVFSVQLAKDHSNTLVLNVPRGRKGNDFAVLLNLASGKCTKPTGAKILLRLAKVRRKVSLHQLRIIPHLQPHCSGFSTGGSCWIAEPTRVGYSDLSPHKQTPRISLLPCMYYPPERCLYLSGPARRRMQRADRKKNKDQSLAVVVSYASPRRI